MNDGRRGTRGCGPRGGGRAGRSLCQSREDSERASGRTRTTSGSRQAGPCGNLRTGHMWPASRSCLAPYQWREEGHLTSHGTARYTRIHDTPTLARQDPQRNRRVPPSHRTAPSTTDRPAYGTGIPPARSRGLASPGRPSGKVLSEGTRWRHRAPLTSFPPKTFPRAFPSQAGARPQAPGPEVVTAHPAQRAPRADTQVNRPSHSELQAQGSGWVEASGDLPGDTAVVRTASEVAVEDTGLGPPGLQPGAGQDPSLGGRREAGRGLPHGPCHQRSAVTLVLGGCPPRPCPPEAPHTVVGRGKGRGSGQRPAHSGSTSETMSSPQASASPSAEWAGDTPDNMSEPAHRSPVLFTALSAQHPLRACPQETKQSWGAGQHPPAPHPSPHGSSGTGDREGGGGGGGQCSLAALP